MCIRDSNLTIKGKLTANPDIFATGVITATAFYGNGSNVTIDGKTWDTYDFIASGNISNGDTVVINTDATVSAISGTGSTTPSVDSVGIFDDWNSNISSIYDPNKGRVVVAYAGANTSSNGYAVVGEIIGTGITFGTPVTVGIDSFNNDAYDITYDSANSKVVITSTNASDLSLIHI